MVSPRTIFGSLSAGLSCVALLVLALVGWGTHSVESPDTVSVLKTSTALPAGTRIDGSHLEIQRVPEKYVGTSFVRASTVTSILDARLKRRIQDGTYLTLGDLVDRTVGAEALMKDGEVPFLIPLHSVEYLSHTSKRGQLADIAVEPMAGCDGRVKHLNDEEPSKRAANQPETIVVENARVIGISNRRDSQLRLAVSPDQRQKLNEIGGQGRLKVYPADLSSQLVNTETRKRTLPTEVTLQGALENLAELAKKRRAQSR